MHSVKQNCLILLRRIDGFDFELNSAVGLIDYTATSQRHNFTKAKEMKNLNVIYEKKKQQHNCQLRGDDRLRRIQYCNCISERVDTVSSE